MLFVGTLEPYKNVDGLAAAWRSVAARVPDASLLIVGSGSQQAVVERLVARVPGTSRATTSGSSRRRSQTASTARRYSSSLPGRKASAGWSSSRSPADGDRRHRRGRDSRPRRRTGSRACSFLRPTPRRSRRRSNACSPTAELAERLGAAAARRYADWHSTPESSPARCGRSSTPRSRAPHAEMRIVFVTQTIDADHPVLAQTVDLVRALAARCESVTVLCDSVRRHDLPGNVTFRTFGARTRPARGLRFARGSRRRCSRGDVDPTPCSRTWSRCSWCSPRRWPRRLRLHSCSGTRTGIAGRSLRLATPLADVVLSVSSGSFPLETPKLVATGHAIDVDPLHAAEVRRPRARFGSSPWAGRRAGRATTRCCARSSSRPQRGLDAQLEVRGPQLTEDEKAHRRELEAAVAESDVLRDRVRIEPPLARDEIPTRLRASDALLSATQPARARHSTRWCTRPPRAVCP